MANLIEIETLLKDRKYPFIFTFFALLISVMILLFANTTTTITVDPIGFYPDIIKVQQQQQQPLDHPPPPPLADSIKHHQEPPPKKRVELIQWEKTFRNNSVSVDLNLNWKLCKGVIAVDYIPCLDNLKAIKALKSRRHMEHRERHCPHSISRCLLPLPKGYKLPVAWPKSRDMVRIFILNW